MKNRFYLTLVLLSVYIIISGCGGGSGTTQPASLTQVPNSSGNKAYITINIKWPEEGKAGNFIISSGNKKEITASMPSGSHKIKAYVVDYTDKDPNTLIDLNDTTGLLASGIAEYPATQLALEVPLDSAIARHLTGNVYLAPFPVKIWAGAFGASGDPNDPNTALISTEQYVELEVGPQLVTLPLGDYDLTLTADPNIISISQTTPIGAARSSSLQASSDEAETTITAKLVIAYPTPLPESTPNNQTVATQKPLEHKLIKFRLEEGSSGILEPDEAYTDPNGFCSTTLKCNETGTKKIIAEFQPDPNNNPEIIYPASCNVYVIEHPDSYNLTLSSSPSTIGVNKTSTVTATLDPPLDGKDVYFNISGPGTLSDTVKKTTDGICQVTVKVIEAGNIQITASCSPDINNPAKTITDNCDIEVIGNYSLTLQTNRRFIIIPDFDETKDFTSVKEITVKAKLEKLFPENPSTTPVPLANKEIQFRVIEGEGGILSSATTSNDGTCEVTLTGGNTPGPRTIKIEAKCLVEQGDNSPVTYVLTVPVSDGLIWKDNFDTYPSGTYAGTLHDYSTWGAFNGAQDSAGEDYIQNYIDTSIGNPEPSLRLYSNISSNSGVNRSISGTSSIEIRLKMKISSINGFGAGEIGDCLEPLSANTKYYLKFQFNVNNSVYDILDCNEHTLLNTFNLNTWYPVRIQYIPASRKFNYWINNNFIKSVVADSYLSPYHSQVILRADKRSIVWFDEVEVYDLSGLNQKN
ncbi:MAG: hypothetical protein ABRQ39_25575 [Candidatus Eremiobacterota bacterium]